MLHNTCNSATHCQLGAPVQTAPDLKIAKILLPTDLSLRTDCAIIYGLRMARHFGATLILLHVVEPNHGVQGARFTSPAAEESNRASIDAAEKALATIRHRFESFGVPIESLVRVGRAYSEIADTANALACDLIVMGTRRAARNATIQGSNADWVVHHASCPVVTVNPA